MENIESQLIVITGCDTGIGKSLAQLFLKKGYSVAGSYLQTPLSDSTFNKKMDLRSENEILDFSAHVENLCRSGLTLKAVIQNAGMVSAAPVENMPLKALREVFEVNYFGVYSLTQKLIPLIIQNKSSIFLVGSLAGKIGLPFFSPYVSSKFAMEGFAESLRREMAPFGVRTVLFEPGAVSTPIWNSSWERIKKDFLPLVGTKYKIVFEAAAGQFINGGNAGLPSDQAAESIYKVLMKKKPHARYIVSKNNFMEKLETWIPTGLMDKIISGLFNMNSIHRE